jgi:hypothetical protein
MLSVGQLNYSAPTRPSTPTSAMVKESCSQIVLQGTTLYSYLLAMVQSYNLPTYLPTISTDAPLPCTLAAAPRHNGAFRRCAPPWSRAGARPSGTPSHKP